jgi:hypothetical protein
LHLALLYGALGEIRTPDTQIRSLVLYPAELQALVNSIVAEREGFEPSIPVSQYTRLAGERLRPTRPSLPEQKDLYLYFSCYKNTSKMNNVKTVRFISKG